MDDFVEDFLSRVMKRSVGGEGSSCESSPEKHMVNRHGFGANLAPHNSNIRNNMNRVAQGLTCTAPPGHENDVEVNIKADEVDGFTTKETNKAELNFVETEPKHPKETIKLDDIIKQTGEPRIEMFSESDSDSNSNPFILSSFQCLNEEPENKKNGFEGCEKRDLDIALNETESDNRREEYGRERSDEVVLKNETDFKSMDDVESNVVSHHGRSEDRKEYETSTVQSRGNWSECTDKRPETEFSSGKNKSSPERDVITSNFNGTSDAKHKELKSEIPENFDTEASNPSEDDMKVNIAEVDNVVNVGYANRERSSSKKSRKQFVPRRVVKTEVQCHNQDAGDRKVNDNFEEKNISEDRLLQEVKDNGVRIDDVRYLGRKIGISNLEASEFRKSEKSRKQVKPMRIEQLEELDHGVESEDIGTSGSCDNIIKDVNQEKESSNGMRIAGYSSDINACPLSRDDNPHIIGKHGQTAEELTKSSDDTLESHDSSDWQKGASGSNASPFASLNTSPYFYGQTPNLGIISNLSPGLLQGGSSSSDNFPLSENGLENLEMIRQIRELRCNRYRKISLAEKREVASYANLHGVSQAAAYYSVSKSAVSMWTKIDFSKIQDQQKKNCMTGNEKFEALCQRVKLEKENKFKGMSKQDKFEVSRYAKVVGVREMARCVDVALGTVSGWMRQFPYKVESEAPDTQLSDDSNSKSSIQNNKDTVIDDLKLGEQTDKSQKRKIYEDSPKGSMKKTKSESNENELSICKNVQKEDSVHILSALEREHSDTKLPSKELNQEDGIENNNCDDTVESLKTENGKSVETSQQKDELDQMIADTWQPPDFEKCYEDIKELIKDSPLEGDDFFRSLFERVVACKAFKYKTLKPSEKLEVVRYAKRVGVRKVAKILGLATGTLSGWNTKYQSNLEITDPNIDVTNKTDLLVSYLIPDKNSDSVDSKSASESSVLTPGSNLDKSETSELTAVKLLFKDRYPVLLNKISVARQVKFRNITTEEKIEFVKCSKLVGIRPTARVFSIPIGTLSGWITKFSKTLHPAYHVDVDGDYPNNSQDSPSRFPGMGIYNPNVVGRTATGANSPMGMMNATPAWQPLSEITPGSQGSSQNLFPQLPIMSASPFLTTTSSVLPHISESSLVSSSLSSPFVSSLLSSSTESSPSSSLFSSTRASIPCTISSPSSSSFIPSSTTTFPAPVCASTSVNRESHGIVSKPNDGDDFEEEAKIMAQRYLTSAYEKMGIPIV